MPILTGIYIQSKININEFYKAAAFISTKSSNTLRDVEKMAYYKFNNLQIHLKELVEAENKGGSPDNDGSSTDFQGMAKSQLSSATSQVKAMSKHI